MELSTSAEIEKLRHQIAQLGNELESLNNSKESFYREKTSFDSLLSNTISEANELKAKKRITDEEIKSKKILRTTLNKELKELSIKMKSMQKAPSTKIKKRLSPDAIKKQVEAMQYAIETEGLSFEKEKQYMDRIKQLKAELAESPLEAAGVPKELRETLTAKKSKADLVHIEIQKLAEDSTKNFDLLTTKAKVIIDAKNKRAAIQTTLKDLKAQIEVKNQDLAEALNQWLTVSKDLPIPVSAEMTAADVINKFKSSKKLTKDDILKLQRLAAR